MIDTRHESGAEIRYFEIDVTVPVNWPFDQRWRVAHEKSFKHWCVETPAMITREIEDYCLKEGLTVHITKVSLVDPGAELARYRICAFIPSAPTFSEKEVFERLRNLVQRMLSPMGSSGSPAERRRETQTSPADTDKKRIDKDIESRFVARSADGGSASSPLDTPCPSGTVDQAKGSEGSQPDDVSVRKPTSERPPRPSGGDSMSSEGVDGDNGLADPHSSQVDRRSAVEAAQNRSSSHPPQMEIDPARSDGPFKTEMQDADPWATGRKDSAESFGLASKEPTRVPVLVARVHRVQVLRFLDRTLMPLVLPKGHGIPELSKGQALPRSHVNDPIAITVKTIRKIVIEQ